MLQRTLLAVAVAVLVAGPAAAAEDPVTSAQDLTRTTCSDLAAQSQEERALSLIFYYGYMAGRAGAVSIDGSAVSGHLNMVRDHCNANPSQTIVDVFAKALGEDD
jgi:hypothetical protein